MNVLLVCRHYFKTAQTGDATQARETAAELRRQGHVVVRLFVKYDPLCVLDESDVELSASELNKLIEASDVVHLLPITIELCRFWRTLAHKPTVGSSIFWAGPERAVVAFRNGIWIRNRIGQMRREIGSFIPGLLDYRGVDMFLPNSEAEGRRVMWCFRHNGGASFRKVINGFVKPEFDLEGLERPVDVPEGDYIVVPAIFAWRKNQLGLIRALRNSKYNVVFLGGVHFIRAYYDLCRKLASNRMIFLAYCSSSEKRYWAILRHARVACLPSDCETPGIAMLEAAYAGARPVITKFGGTLEYYGDCAEYLNPCSDVSIRRAIDRGWARGRMNAAESQGFLRYNWQQCGIETIAAYREAIERYGVRR